MKICSSCGFKVLDNQKYCPRCGLPINSKPILNTPEDNIIETAKDKVKDENESKDNLNTNSNKDKKHLKNIVVISMITIVVLGGIFLISFFLSSGDGSDGEKDKDEELRYIITYVKTQYTEIMKSEDIVFIKFDEKNNRYLFESTYEASQEQYYYYPETDEITINYPGFEVIINNNFEFKTTFWGEPSPEEESEVIYIYRRTQAEEVIKINDSIGNMAEEMFKDMLDYAIAPYMEWEVNGIELYLVRVNKGQPWYTVYEFLLGSDGNIYDYWEKTSNNNLVRIEL